MAAGETARTGAGLSKFRNLPDSRAEMVVSTPCSSSTITTRASRKSAQRYRSLPLHLLQLCLCAYGPPLRPHYLLFKTPT